MGRRNRKKYIYRSKIIFVEVVNKVVCLPRLSEQTD